MASADASQGASHMLPVSRRETELQTLLADERLRNEQHKINYQTLKTQHTRLQDEYLSLQMEMKQVMEECQQVKGASHSAVESAEKLLVQKQKEIDEITANAIAMSDAARLKIQEDIEKPYAEKHVQLEAEADHYHKEFNRLRYEHSMLKSKFEYSETEHQRIVDEMKLCHHAEMSRLQQEVEALAAQQSMGQDEGNQRLRSVQRENVQLHGKIRSLVAELEEVRANQQKSTAQIESAGRHQALQKAELMANIRALETEKASLQMQKDSVQKELAGMRQSQANLMQQLHSIKEELLRQQSQCEDFKHKSQVEATNLKLETVKQRMEAERERDRLLADLSDLRLDIQTSKEALDRQGRLQAEHEWDLQRKANVVRLQDLEKIRVLESEKVHVERKFKDLEKSAAEIHVRLQEENSRLMSNLKSAERRGAAMEHELTDLRSRLEELQAKIVKLDKIKEENRQLREHMAKLQSELQESPEVHQKLAYEQEQLKEALDLAYKELEIAKAQMAQMKELSEKTVLQQQMDMEQERHQHQCQIEGLKGQMKNAHSRVDKEMEGLRNKQKRYEKLISKLRSKLQILEAQKDELELERETLKRTIPAAVQAPLKRQLLDFRKKHEEFRQILISNLPGIMTRDENGASHYNVPTVIFPRHRTTIFHSDIPDSKSAQELEELKERLDHLDRQQQKQMQELLAFTKKLEPSADQNKENEPKTLSISSDSDDI